MEPCPFCGGETWLDTEATGINAGRVVCAHKSDCPTLPWNFSEEKKRIPADYKPGFVDY